MRVKKEIGCCNVLRFDTFRKKLSGLNFTVNIKTVYDYINENSFEGQIKY